MYTVEQLREFFKDQLALDYPPQDVLGDLSFDEKVNELMSVEGWSFDQTATEEFIQGKIAEHALHAGEKQLFGMVREGIDVGTATVKLLKFWESELAELASYQFDRIQGNTPIFIHPNSIELFKQKNELQGS